MEIPSDTDVVDSGPVQSPAGQSPVTKSTVQSPLAQSPVTKSVDEVPHHGPSEKYWRDDWVQCTNVWDQNKELLKQNKELKDEIREACIRLEVAKKFNKASSSVCTSSSATVASAEQFQECQTLRHMIDTYKRKLHVSENRSKELQAQVENFEESEALLLTRNKDLTERLDYLDRELALSRLNQRTESEDIAKCFNGFKLDSDSEEFEFAFPKSSTQITTDQQVHELSIVNQEQCQQIENLMVQNEDLKYEVDTLRREIEALYQQNNVLQTENNELTQKYSGISIDNESLTQEVNSLNTEITRTKEILNQIEERTTTKNDLIKKQEASLETLKNVNDKLVASIKEMGFQHVAFEKEIEDLKSKLKNEAKSLDRFTQLESDTNNKILQMTAKLDYVKKISDFLRRRVSDLVGFLEGLLEVESRGLPVLDKVLRNHREMIESSLKQSQMLSEVLGQILLDEMPMVDLQLIDVAEFNAATLKSIQLSAAAFEVQSPRPRSRPSTASISIQCDRTTEVSVSRAAEIRSNLLQRENLRLEATKDRLIQEKADLYARVSTLEANLHAIQEQGNPIIIDDLKRRLERREKAQRSLESAIRHRDQKLADTLNERDDARSKLESAQLALRSVHDDNAKLVMKLSGMRDTYSKENYDALAHKTKSEEAIRQEDSSPDLGIESGHDAPPSENVLKVSNHGKDYSNEELRMLNRDLAAKLKHTRNALDKTLEKLDKTTKEKEQVQKAVCRQLHKTHQILRTAKKNLESPGGSELDLGDELQVSFGSLHH